METLFRLALVRPPVGPEDDRSNIKLVQQTNFQAALGAASQQDDIREAMRGVAGNLVNGPLYISQPNETPLFQEIRNWGAALDGLESQDKVIAGELQAAVQQAFGEELAVLVGDGTLDEPMMKLRDSLLAIKLLPREHSKPVEELVRQLRDLEVIVTAAQDPVFPETGSKLRRFRRRSLELPNHAELRSILSTAKQEEARQKAEAEQQAKRKAQVEKLVEQYQILKAAIDELTAFGGDDYINSPQKADAGFDPPAEFTPIGEQKRRSEFLRDLSVRNLTQIDAAIERAGTDRQDPLRGQDLSGVTSASTLADRVFAGTEIQIDGTPGFQPIAIKDVAFRLKDSSIQGLSSKTQKVLAARQINLAAVGADYAVEILEREAEKIGEEIESLFGERINKTVRRIGQTLLTVATPEASPWASIVVGKIPSLLPGLLLDGRIPQSRGKVRPSGVADLLVVKQQLVRYEGVDVAHIENVLKGESKSREHTRRRETEEFTLVETETTSSEERELETTSRFEMSRETSKTIKEDASLKAGLTVSGKYGPTVEFSASAEGSLSRSKEEATKSASNFSQDVTQRSANKITERILERTSLKVTNEVIEKNTHELNNTAGDQHISGVYQWVNKVYQCQMFNYGLRAMFDFMVPEPAAFLIDTLSSAHASALELEKPTPFTLRPLDVSESNYGYWVRAYGATDVTPPPEIYITKSMDFSAGGGDSNKNYQHSAQIAIDDGYQAVQGSVALVHRYWQGSSASLDLALGRRTNRFTPTNSWVWTTSLSDERDSIPIALASQKMSSLAVAVEVKCKRTARAMKKWKLETHAKLMTAYQARLAEYEEKLAALELEAGVEIEGRNPGANLEIMKDELRKNCISILTNQHFDLFNAIDHSSGIPQINFFEAAGEGSYVRFFEQAFEWEHLTWVSYPYFWGRKNQWANRIAYEDPDPLFNQFLKAGYCRVSVPVRRGFEGAVDHFMTYGELWNGGPLPTISSPLFLPIADEIAESLDRPGDETPQGDPWTVRIPTTLVHLRPDDQLPRWKQDASGAWVEE